jgi:hypothetical protein
LQCNQRKISWIQLLPPRLIQLLLSRLILEGVGKEVPTPSKAKLRLTSEQKAFQESENSINFLFSESVQAGGLSQEFLQHLGSLNQILDENEPEASTPTQSDFLCSSRPIRVRPEGLAHVLTQSELEVYNHVIRSHCSNAKANEWLRIMTKVLSCEWTNHVLVHAMMNHVLVHESNTWVFSQHLRTSSSARALKACTRQS